MRRSPASASGRARASSRRAVGGERDVDAEAGQAGDEVGQAGPHGRLAAGQPDRVDAEPVDAHPRDPLDLLEREHSDRGSHSIPSAGMQ